MKNKDSSLATTSMVVGIVGVVFSWVPVLAQILGILAIVFGFISKNKINNSKDTTGKGMAIAGIIMGFISFFGIAFIIGVLAYFGVLNPK